MNKILAFLVFAFSLTACITWDVNPQPIPAWTAIPSRTPGIVSPTPLIITVTSATLPYTLTPSATVETPTITLTPIDTPSITPTDTISPPTLTFTPASSQAVQIEILGCNTSIDIAHGMGEVTNAFITVKNIGTTDLSNTCALLRASDEDRVHPDKQRCVDNLPVGNQVTQKLTVDSAYKQDTLIQVDVTSNDIVLLRVDKQSCRDIGLLTPVPANLGVVIPIP